MYDPSAAVHGPSTAVHSPSTAVHGPSTTVHGPSTKNMVLVLRSGSRLAVHIEYFLYQAMNGAIASKYNGWPGVKEFTQKHTFGALTHSIKFGELNR